MASRPASSSAPPPFNGAQAQDFLALRWAAAQRENPTIYQSEQGTASPAGSAAAQKKAGGAWGIAGNRAGAAAQRGGPGTASTAPQTSSFATNLIKAAGQRRGTGAGAA
ncbi:hypothetical protein BDZ90DRAFT_260713 [Jaminaea rosea]|uniref:Uncharacterized protein n=1 Tax=Jaminaea rosea TaxID=1569628 RepID=A0A316UP26_9BASI|nr:hypothetical protein BDZ90DRAFT_260713 [Jaminaea rosea]PWN27037.1 hypothetical protein BDZ90DRAFT_260713 [Jaminaea rosea]